MNLMIDALQEFDTHTGLTHANEDEGLYCEVLGMFHAQLKEQFATLPDQLSNSSYDSVARQVHTLKGSATALGATRLAATSAEIDSLLKSGEVPDRAMIEALKIAVQATSQDLAAAGF